MSSLLLDSLEIRNFRAFRHLKMERLARVNLIVGENNVGKTTLLEALLLYACRGEPSVALNLLSVRDEVSEKGPSTHLDAAIRRLFSYAVAPQGHPRLWNRSAIQISSLYDSTKSLTMWVGQSQRYLDKSLVLRLKLLEKDETDFEASPAFAVQGDSDSRMLIFPFDTALPRNGAIPKPIKHVFIPVSGLDNKQLADLWDNITLTDLEKEVIAALQLIAPDVEHLNFVNREQHSLERIPKVRVAGCPEPIALRSMGEGIVRLLGITLGLVNAQNGLLLIDEFDSTLHHLVQVEAWRVIFDLAQRLNVQVFATTHSWDCIDTFEKAAYQNKEVEGVLFSLRNKKEKPGEVVALLFDEEDLEVVAEDRIEVR